MRNLLSTMLNLATRDRLEGLVWLLLGVEWMIVVAVAFTGLLARVKRNMTARRRQTAYQRFFERFQDATTHRETLISSLPNDAIGALLRWWVTHHHESTALGAKIGLLLAEAEGNSSRLLDFAKVTSPLLGLAGTLLGLQQAFSQAGLGKAAVEAGIATALNTTYAGILIAIAAFFVLRFLVDTTLERVEAELWEVGLKLTKLASVRAQNPVRHSTESEQRLRRSSAWDAVQQQPPATIGVEPLDGQ